MAKVADGKWPKVWALGASDITSACLLIREGGRGGGRERERGGGGERERERERESVLHLVNRFVYLKAITREREREREMGVGVCGVERVKERKTRAVRLKLARVRTIKRPFEYKVSFVTFQSVNQGL